MKASLDASQEYDAGVLESLNAWAHSVRDEKPLSQKQRRKARAIDPDINRAAKFIDSNKRSRDKIVVVHTEQDVEKIAEFVKPLPLDRKSMTKVFKKVDRIDLAPDEKLVMVDSGSFCHAINARKELPGHFVHPVKGCDDSTNAESACGGIMKRRGRVKTLSSIDEMELALKWNDMDVKVPILSVRRLCHDHHHLKVGFNHQGGYIHDLLSQKRIQILEYQGVYYVKMKFLPPPNCAESKPDFHRQVTA